MRPSVAREILTLSDGGVIAVDWMENEESHHRDSGTRPTVLILPGLTGAAIYQQIPSLSI